MCQGRKPSVLSTGPNFSTRSGSGMFSDSAWEKTCISGMKNSSLRVRLKMENNTGTFGNR